MKLYKDEIDMMSLLRKITPLARTIANNDTDKALQILTEFLPGALIEGFPSGSKAWSWTIPRRWELHGATIRANGETLVDVAWNPLHVIDYSQPFKGTVEREELLKHLRTIPERPQAIPFVFSFYEPVWGFSIPHDWLSRFTSDAYDVEINSRFEDGNLNTLSMLIPGDSEEIFVICSNICHPTQVNDSLTGVAVALDIASRLLTRESRKYSYLIMVVPETIGSIAYLSNHPEIIDTSIGGFFSEMLGTNGPLVGQRTRRGDTYWDKILEDVLTNSNLPNKVVSFLKSACNDEKVLDSPGVDIPTFSLTRFPYPEYHTSDDNIELIDVERIREARDLLQKIIDFAEEDYIPVLNQPGPIFLSGHGLYPNWRDDPSLIPLWESFFDVMYSIDGVHSVIELANLRQIPISHFFYWTDAFAQKGLLIKKSFLLGRKVN
ncbi:DUF4910 domain-containing protein [Leptospira alstonii]|uniref:DUF4910 domain-containing protein n=1 Tax=Leptospira alstonii TaxID=28452 RepID=UPI0007736BDC|nr:DUF4910 domain-containing protein [Leptospira alstonii]